MRAQLLKLQKGKSTKAERIFAELCKELHVPFRSKVRISGREVDFLIGNYAIEINGHEQLISKNSLVLELGYIPVNISNDEVIQHRDELKHKIKLLWQEHETQS